MTSDSHRSGHQPDNGDNGGAQLEWHLAREQGDAYGDALQHATQMAAGDSGECRTGGYWITYLVDSPRRIYTWAERRPLWREPEDADLYVGIAVRDATDGRFIPATRVGVTLLDETGTVVGAGEHSLVWDPLAHQYGRNWHIEGAGPHSMRIRVEPPTRAQAGAEESMRPIEVEFSGLDLKLGRPARGGPRWSKALPEQPQL